MSEQGFEVFKGFNSTPYTRVCSELPATGVDKAFKDFKPLMGSTRAPPTIEFPECKVACQVTPKRDRASLITAANSAAIADCAGQRSGQSTPSSAAFPALNAGAQRIANRTRSSQRASTNTARCAGSPS
jgi:hypothetical protein